MSNLIYSGPVQLPSALMILKELELLNPSSVWKKHVFEEKDFSVAIQFLLEKNDFDEKQNLLYYFIHPPQFLAVLKRK